MMSVEKHIDISALTFSLLNFSIIIKSIVLKKLKIVMFKKLKNIKFKELNNIDKIVLICFFTFSICEIVKNIFNLSERSTAFFRWGYFICKNLSFITMITLFSLLIISGLFKIRTDGFSWIKLVMPSFGIIFCVVYIGVLTWGQAKMTKMIEIMEDKGAVATSIRLLNKEMEEPFDTELKNRIPAKSLYFINGEQVLYPSTQGNLQLFEPTEEEKSSYEEMSESKKGLKHVVETFRFSALVWMFALIASISIGIFYPLKKKE